MKFKEKEILEELTESMDKMEKDESAIVSKSYQEYLKQGLTDRKAINRLKKDFSMSRADIEFILNI